MQLKKKKPKEFIPDIRENIIPDEPLTTEQCSDQTPELILDTDDVFLDYLDMLSQCKTFAEVQTTCRALNLEPVSGFPRSMIGDNLFLDDLALELYPEDYDINSFPVSVKADGDCLPACGSVFLYGNDMRSEEVLVRIISELALNIDFYLEDDNLRKGLPSNVTNDSLKKIFAMFSADFIPGIALTDNIIRMILEKEIKSICTHKSFMGIWQIFALASVLQMQIFSVYPMLGENLYRTNLHRVVFPRVLSNCHTVAIMWTSTRDDMVSINWKPNHFVPIVPIEFIESKEPETTIQIEIITAQEHNDEQRDNHEREDREQTNIKSEQPNNETHISKNESVRVENNDVDCKRIVNENQKGFLLECNEAQGA